VVAGDGLWIGAVGIAARDAERIGVSRSRRPAEPLAQRLAKVGRHERLDGKCRRRQRVDVTVDTGLTSRRHCRLLYLPDASRIWWIRIIRYTVGSHQLETRRIFYLEHAWPRMKRCTPSPTPPPVWITWP